MPLPWKRRAARVSGVGEARKQGVRARDLRHAVTHTDTDTHTDTTPRGTAIVTPTLTATASSSPPRRVPPERGPRARGPTPRVQRDRVSAHARTRTSAHLRADVPASSFRARVEAPYLADSPSHMHALGLRGEGCAQWAAAGESASGSGNSIHGASRCTGDRFGLRVRVYGVDDLGAKLVVSA